MDRELIGQESIYNVLDSVIKDPPHIFLTGPYGYGKTSIALAFIKQYYKQFNKESLINSSDWVLHLSSDSDRGIHRVRENVAEFVRHTSSSPGMYRWIFVDDADTLPTVSQQALRRPMETHAHTTRFIFCSRHISDLISPLRSRCLHIEVETIALSSITDIYSSLNLSKKTQNFLLTTSLSPRQLIQYIKCIQAYGKEFNEDNFCNLFSGTSDERIYNLIKSFIKKESNKMIDLIFLIWNSGISYEDFLTDLSRCSKMMGIISPQNDQRIHELIIQGWIYYTHGRTHILDIFALFQEN